MNLHYPFRSTNAARQAIGRSGCAPGWLAGRGRGGARASKQCSRNEMVPWSHPFRVARHPVRQSVFVCAFIVVFSAQQVFSSRCGCGCIPVASRLRFTNPRSLLGGLPLHSVLLCYGLRVRSIGVDNAHEHIGWPRLHFTDTLCAAMQLTSNQNGHIVYQIVSDAPHSTGIHEYGRVYVRTSLAGVTAYLKIQTCTYHGRPHVIHAT
jgi:hypothetical protein